MRIAQITVYPIDISNELMPSMYDNATPAKEAWDSVSLIYEYLLRTIKFPINGHIMDIKNPAINAFRINSYLNTIYWTLFNQKYFVSVTIWKILIMFNYNNRYIARYI